MLNKTTIKLGILSFFLIQTIFSAEPSYTIHRNQILYLLQSNHLQDAIKAYKKYQNQTGKHDFKLLEKIGLTLLEQGSRSQDPEILLLTYFGAGISLNEKALRILQDGLNHSNPQLQLICLNLLAQFQNDEADDSLNRAMNSDEGLVRLEAALHLAEKKSAKAFPQIESLMHKMIPEILPLFPQLFALLGTRESDKMLKKLLIHSDENVRIATVLSLTKHQRDDFLPYIRRMLSHPGCAQQEACAFAIGKMKDENSAEKLMRYLQSNHTNVVLAALRAFYQLGRLEAKETIAQAASQGQIFAIALLGEMENSESHLIPLLKHSNLQVRYNAALALLDRENPACTPTIIEILIKDHKDLSMEEVFSIGKTLKAWKFAPNQTQNGKDNPLVLEMSLNSREEILEKTLKLPEKNFLQITETMLKKHQNDLIPLTIQLLAEHGTANAVQLLKTYKDQPGAPLIRNYCNLALYQLKEEGPYLNNLKQWLLGQQTKDLIKLRPFVPWEFRSSEHSYQLTPEETSRLIVQTYETFIAARDDEGINILLEGIKADNKKNRYALAGLLLRAAQ